MNDTHGPSLPVSEDERVRRLLDELTATGFQITPEQRVRAMGLFLELRLSGLLPRDRRRLGNMLAAVLCRSAEEQHEFHRVFSYCFLTGPGRQAGPDDRPCDHDLQRRIEEERRAFHEEAERRRREAQMQALRRQMQAAMPRLAVIFALAVVLQLWLRPYTPSSNRRSGPSEQTIPGRNSTRARTPPPDPSDANDWRGSLAGRIAAVRRTLGPVTTLLLMIPLGCIALVAASSRRLLSAYARQVQVLPRQEFRQLLSRGGSNAELLGPTAYRDVQPMRRQVETASTALSIDATIEATVSAGGLFTPVYVRRRGSPEYVVLLDRRHGGDHQAYYGRTFVDFLDRAGVHLTVYTFDGDPRRLALGSAQRTFYLDDLTALQRSHRLIMFSAGDGLFDAATGLLHPWAEWFAQWSIAVLLSPRDVADWGVPEWMIESQLGIAVLPATEEGLSIAARIFDPEDSTLRREPHSPVSLLPASERLHGFFSVASWRWVDPIEPPTQEVDALMELLRAELSTPALDLLRALAVYPSLYWSLTLYLGSRIADPREEPCFARRLVEIVRLPWLRHGRMPAWLRKRLIQEMPTALRKRVREVLEGLLLTVVSREPKDFALDLGLMNPPGAAARWNLDREDLRKDSIMIDFMSKREASPEDFRLSSRLAAVLGLPRMQSGLRSLMGRAELDAMALAADELTRLARENPLDIHSSRFRKVDPSEFSPGVNEIVEYAVGPGRLVTHPGRLYLLIRNPNQPVAILLDQFSIRSWAQRKQLTLRFGAGTMVALALISAAVHWRYFDEMPSIGVATLLLSAIIYAPFAVFWLLLMRPFGKVLQRFPLIQTDITRGAPRMSSDASGAE